MIWDTLEAALFLVPLAIGITISFRIVKFPDLTVDASFAAGGCISALLIFSGHPKLCLFGSILIGMLSGLMTASLNIFLKVSKILSGFLVIFIVYSMNLFFFTNKKGNISLIVNGEQLQTPISFIEKIGIIPSLIIVLIILTILIRLFFKTEVGLFFIANGQNEQVVSDLGHNPKLFVFAGLILSNALIALSGGLLASKWGFGDVNMGNGFLLIGLAIIVVGQISVFFIKFIWKKIFIKDIEIHIISTSIIGVVVYHFLIAFSLLIVKIPPEIQRFVIALIILIPIVIARFISESFEIEDLL